MTRGNNSTMKIKDYLLITGKTQAEFAQEVGISQGLVSMYASGRKSPRKKTANVIFKVSRGAITYADLYAEVEA